VALATGLAGRRTRRHHLDESFLAAFLNWARGALGSAPQLEAEARWRRGSHHLRVVGDRGLFDQQGQAGGRALVRPVPKRDVVLPDCARGRLAARRAARGRSPVEELLTAGGLAEQLLHHAGVLWLVDLVERVTLVLRALEIELD